MVLQAPMSFYPVNHLDHIEVDINLTLKIGVNNSYIEDELLNFLIILNQRVRTTGAELVCQKHAIVNTSPYVGSRREKLDYDATCETKEVSNDRND